MGLRKCAVVLIAVVSQAGPSLGQTSPGMAPSYTGGSTADYERQQREYWRAQEAERMEQRRRQEMNDEQRRRDEEASKRNYRLDGGTPPAGSAQSYGGSQAADMRALGKELLRLPPLPVERNVLLGSWRLEGGGQQNRVLEFGLTGKGATPGMGELMGFMKSIESGQLTCDMSFGRGITFTPTTFSSGGAAGIAGGPVAYRSRKKQVIVAIPGDSRANPMFFEIVGPDRIEAVNVGCALVRVGAPATGVAANTKTMPGNARLAAASPSALPAAGMAPQVAAAANATNAKLAVGPDAGGYVCPDGRQLYVKSCYDESSESRCGVVNMHLPPRNNFQVVTTEIRSEVLSRVAACKILPLQFMNGTVSLVMPKSAPP